MVNRFVVCALILLSAGAFAAKPPKPDTVPVFDTSSPRGTLKTFMAAMNDYRLGLETGSCWHERRIVAATRCLHLEPIPEKRRKFYGNSSAAYLKEVIDRTFDGNYDLVPEAGVDRWQLGSTMIVISKVTSGERSGEFLISSGTVQTAQYMYEQLRHKPYLKGTGRGALVERKVKRAGDELYIKRDNPRKTVRTFMEAMNDYKRGLSNGDRGLKARLKDAVNCLQTSEIPELLRAEKAKEAAILLKEVIDRIIVIDYARIPELKANGDSLDRWRMAKSKERIVVVPMTTGERKGEYLFSSRTVAGIADFYDEIKDQPYLPRTGGGAGYAEPILERIVPEWMRGKMILLPNWQWVGLFLAILLGYVAKTITQHLLVIGKKVASRSKMDWDDKLIEVSQKPMGLLGASVFWYFSIHALRFAGQSRIVLTLIVQVLFSIAAMWTLYRLTDVLTEYLGCVAQKTDTSLDNHLVPLIKRALRTFVVIFGVLITVQNLGFNVMSLLAGLGLGGLAFALAARDTCANFFGSIMILTDRPFKIGEWVKAGGMEGIVEEIGFRSTRIRTFYDSLVTIPNSVLANANIDNLGQRTYRRTVAKIGVTYDTPAEKIEAFTEGIKNIMKANPNVRKDYFIVSFNEYGDFSLNIMLYFFFKVNNWSEEMMERHNVYLEILRLADEMEISFAFPTQSIYLENMPNSGFQPAHPEYTVEDMKKKAASFGPNGENSRPGGSGIYLPPHIDPELKGE